MIMRNLGFVLFLGITFGATENTWPNVFAFSFRRSVDYPGAGQYSHSTWTALLVSVYSSWRT